MKLIKQAFPYIFVIIAFISCTNKNDSSKLSETEVKQKAETNQKGTVMFIVRGKTELSEAEMERKMKERAPQFQKLSGLIQKYYIKTKNPGEFGGVYIWDTMESFNEYKESDLVKTIAAAYQLTETPSTELIDIIYELRD